jgi:Family of unknown function (DUF6049)/Glycosyl hydrolase family 57
MRRPLALAIASLLASAFLVVPSGRALAQEPPVRLTLLEQTPQWNDPAHPSVTLRIRAQNTGGDAIDDLRLGVTMWSPVYSRTAFEESLASDPSTATIFGETLQREGTLGPGDVRDFTVRLDLPLAQLNATQSFIYPLKVDLRSGFRSLAAIRTPIIYLVRRPLSPLALAWTFVLHAQLGVGPDGTFVSSALETSISPGGRLAGEISALTHVVASGVGVDLAVSPLLLLQLEDMSDGYRVADGEGFRTVASGRDGSAAAADAIDRLRRIAAARNVELSALPYSEPLLPALTSGGLARDLGVQLERGRELVADVLGRAPTTTVFRPPRSAIDEPTLDELPGAGISTLLLDPASVPRTEDAQGFAASPIVSLAAQNATLAGVVSDPAVQTMLTSSLPADDPVLGAQAMLGELASIWLQQPGLHRGVAMTLGEDVLAAAGFYVPLVRGITEAPWLAKRTASALTTDPDMPPPKGVTSISSSASSFSGGYVDALKQARRRVEILRSMLVQPSGQPGHLDQLLLLAESQRFVGDERSGMGFVGRVNETVASLFGAVRPVVTQPITLTSSSIRNVPIAVRNSADVPLRVTMRLASQYLLTPVERTRVLPPDSTQTMNVDLELRTTGKFQVRAQIVTPSGRVIGGAWIVIRSTAYNRIALVITIGAALLAMLVWARRFVPRRTG